MPRNTLSTPGGVRLSKRAGVRARAILAAGLVAVCVSGCAGTTPENSAAKVAPTSVSADEAREGQASQAKAPQITMGNGDKNWIVLDGVSRSDNTLRFKEVRINGNGWLVMHPFEDGKPNGDKYVASTYLKDGANADVAIEVFKGVESGEMFIVMLHRDVNENQIFDFVFVDDVNVMDTAVFEGTKMIGHAIPAP